MNLKNDEAITAAMAKTYKGVSKERKEHLMAHLHAANRRGNLEELHGVFTTEEGGLTSGEKHFYLDVVENVPVQGKPASDKQAVNGATPHANDAQ